MSEELVFNMTRDPSAMGSATGDGKSKFELPLLPAGEDYQVAVFWTDSESREGQSFARYVASNDEGKIEFKFNNSSPGGYAAHLGFLQAAGIDTQQLNEFKPSYAKGAVVCCDVVIVPRRDGAGVWHNGKNFRPASEAPKQPVADDADEDLF